MLVAVALGVGALVALARPFENTFPAYLDNAEALVHHGRQAASAFWPTGYETFVAAGVALGGHTGVVVLQVLAYAALVAIAYGALRLLGPAPWTSAFGALAVGLHPQFLVDVTRITDLNLSGPLVLALVAVAIWIERRGLTFARAATFGLVAGSMVAVRANLVVLLPVAIFVIRHRLRLRQSVAAAGAALLVPLVTSAIMVGDPSLLSSNGPYNFAAGANDHAQHELLRNYNAELSLVHYFGRFEVRGLGDLEAPSKQSELTSFGADYVRDHPAQFAKLAAIKLATTFRPDLRPREPAEGARSAFETLVNVVSALPPLVWLVAALLAARAGIRTPPLTTPVVIAFAALFVLPLVLTDADPRFRYPLDTIFLLHAAALAGTWWDRRRPPRLA